MLIRTSAPQTYSPYSSAVANTQMVSNDPAGPVDTFEFSSRDRDDSGLQGLKTVSMALMGASVGGLLGCFIPSSSSGPVIAFSILGAIGGMNLAARS